MSDEGPQAPNEGAGLSRRSFLRRSAAAAAVPALAQLTGGTVAFAKDQKHGHNRGPSADLEEKSIKELQDALERGDLTSRDLVEMYLERINALDKSGPRLNSIIEINPDALDIADAMDAERAQGRTRGPLHGIPLVFKANIDTGDKMESTAGSLALSGVTAPSDSTLAERYRKAGAVIMAKTNLSEWANFRGARPVSGWSGKGRLTLNPYVLDRSGCGSSTGSAVAVAASLAAGSLGTETNGSIVCPASVCGAVGLKPTVGLTSRAGVIPISGRQDTIGPICRTVADAAVMLGPLTGVDPRDPGTRDSVGKSFDDYTRFLDAGGLKGARIGVLRHYSGSHEHVDRIVEPAIQVLRDAGAVVVDPVSFKDYDGFGKLPATDALLYEFKDDLNKYLAGRPELAARGVGTLAGLIQFNKTHADVEMPYFLQELFDRAQAKGPLTDPDYVAKLEAIRKFNRESGIDEVLQREHLDALFAPTRNPAWTIDLLNGDRSILGSSTPAALSGYPLITINAGQAFGALPVGVTFMGTAWSEPKLIKYAYAFEQATHARRPPRYLPHLDLP